MTTQIDILFEQAYQDVDRFITDRFDMLRDLQEVAPTGRILKSGSESWGKGWETGFKRCLAIFQQAAERQERVTDLLKNSPETTPEVSNAPKAGPKDRQ